MIATLLAGRPRYLVDRSPGSSRSPRTAPDAPPAGPLIAFGLALIPFVFVVLAFLSGAPAGARGRRRRRWGSRSLVGIPVAALAPDAVTGLVAGVGGGRHRGAARRPHAARGSRARSRSLAVSVFVVPDGADRPGRRPAARADPPVHVPRRRRSPGRTRAERREERQAAATPLTRFGRFDDDAREYVITRPDTPLPWINYLGSEEYFGLISNTGGGYSFYRDATAPTTDPLPVQRRPRRHRRPVPLRARRRDRRVLVAVVAAGPSRPRGLPMPARARVHGHRVPARRDRGGDPLPRAARRDARDLADADHQPSRRRRARCPLFSAVEFCLWDAWDDQTNYQRNLSTGEVEVVGRRHLPHDRVPGASEPLRVLRLLGGARRLRHAARGVPRPVPRMGSTGSPSSSGRSSDSIAHGWAPIGSHHVELELGPGETREVVFVLGYGENPPDAKFDPPGSRTIDTRSRPPRDRAIPPRARRSTPRSTGCATRWAELLERAPGLDAERAHRPDGERLEPLPVHGDVQPVPLGVVLRHGDRSRHRLPRLEPGPARVRAHGARARARERILDLAATQLPTGGAYHQYQPLTKRGNDAIGSGLQRRPALARSSRSAAYVKETGDLAILDEPVPYDNEPGSETPLYEHLRRALGYTLDRLGPHGLPADRQGGLERLPQPERVLGGSRRVLPDGPQPGGRGRRVGVHRRAVRARRGGARASSPSCVGCRTMRRAARAERDADDGGGARARLGRRLVPARLRLTSARWSAPRRTTRGRSGSSRRASA